METLFSEHKTIIVFLHVLSAVVWVGGMIAVRFAAHQSFMKIETPEIRIDRVLHTLKRLFTIVAPFVITLLVTAVIMIKGYALAQSDLSMFVHAKELIWSIMTINLIVMILRRNRAKKLLDKGDLRGAKFSLNIIGTYMVPVNILLGITAIFLGTYFSSTL